MVRVPSNSLTTRPPKIGSERNRRTLERPRACRNKPRNPNFRWGFLSLAEPSALMMVVAKGSLRPGQRASSAVPQRMTDTMTTWLTFGGEGTQGLALLNAIADGVIAISFFAIPAALIFVQRRRSDRSAGEMALMTLFVLFLFVVGLAHLTAMIGVWTPTPGLQAVVKAAGALLALTAAIVTWKLVPQLLRLPSRDRLQAEVAAHLRTFEELTSNREWAEEIKRVYHGDIDRVDTTVGLFAENPPKGFGFSDTAFRIFILMATRRIKSDRFYTDDFNEKTYTPAGIKWILENGFQSVLIRHFPELAPKVKRVKNGFFPWPTD